MWQEKEHKNWIVIINSQHAKIFCKTKIGKNKSIDLAQELTSELDSEHEKPGRTFSSVGALRHAIEPHTDRREVEKERFARKIIETLKESKNQNLFEKFILIADPKMIGILDNIMEADLKNLILEKVTKNLLNLDNNEIKDYLDKQNIGSKNHINDNH